ncbi:nucleoside hydrolase [Saccharospirillum salsuginis]|uniref:Nucleoside hydrolase n=1 Tax=Saccharospirillum salsuginis TaxID=418750 RepID=A0A918KUD9_9GAMM|nr:nucleoside hydrolase [Saccharospirillum salsuginis]GGX74742.1 nucleoside hydrolase [Saccharospirillum salsuginis]
MARKVIIDTDPGIDDAMAILFAFKASTVEVLGLTTIFGNVGVDRATDNALSLTELSGIATPVARGAAAPLKMDPRQHADYVHGADGFGNIGWPGPKRKPDPRSAAQFIVDSVLEAPGEVTLVALGPLTNLALALELEPDIAGQVREVVLMGGAVHETGNVSPVAEANIINDPHAADAVFGAGWPVTMLGLDVTHQVLLKAAVLDRIRQANPDQGDFLSQAAEHYFNFYRQSLGIDGCYFHDAATIAYVMDPSLFGCRHGVIRVATEGLAIGQTMMAPEGRSFPTPGWEGRPLTKVAVEVDDVRVLALFEQTLSVA